MKGVVKCQALKAAFYIFFMKTVANELKLALINRNAAILIILFFICMLIKGFCFDSPQNAEIEIHKEHYNRYFQLMKSPLTNENNEFFSQQSNNFVNTRTSISQTKNSFFSGRISEQEYALLLSQTDNILQAEKAFNEIYNQYLYATQSPNERWVIKTNGWNYLLVNENAELLLTLVLILLITPIYCHDISNGMDKLSATTVFGNTNWSFAKPLTALALCLLTEISYITAKLSVAFFRFGLNYKDAPLQSLAYFETSAKHISLFSAIVFLFIMHFIGVLFFAAIIMLLSVLTKKYAPVVMISFSIILLPFFVFSENIIYSFIAPLSFLIGSGFLRGSIILKGDAASPDKIVFAEKSITYIAVLIFIVLAICIFIAAIIGATNRNKWLRYKGLFVMLLISVMLSGCSKGSESEISFDVYNTLSTNFCSALNSEIYIEPTKNQICANIDGKEYPLVKTLFASDYEIKNTMFSNKNKLYYFKTTSTKNGFARIGTKNPYRTFSIIAYDILTSEEKVVFEKMVSGIENKWRFLYSVQHFFISDNDYFFVLDNEIRVVNKTFHTIKSIFIDTISNIAFDGENIFYLNNQQQVCKMNIKNNCEISNFGIYAINFYLVDNNIIFIDPLNNNFVYSYNTYSKKSKLLLDTEAINIYSDKSKLFVLNKAGNNLLVSPLK